MIKLDQVSKKFGALAALENVSFELNLGGMLFITGPSGSGKTTLMRLLTRELKVDEGTIEVNGFDLKKMKASQVPLYRQEIGMVFQDFKLIPDLNVYENIAVPLRVKGWKKHQIHTSVKEVASLVGLEGRLEMFPTQLAGGELQRACLARAVVANPPVLLADEPTGNLDSATSWQIMQLVRRINENGTTIIMATHNMDIVNSLKLRQLRLEKGQLIYDSQNQEISDK